MTKNLKDTEKEKHKINNEKIAKSRIKLGLLLNEYGEKNNLKVSDDEVRAEIQKQINSRFFASINTFNFFSTNTLYLPFIKKNLTVHISHLTLIN